MSQSSFVLHTWPACWDLPSYEPTCLAAILYFQLVLPGKFIIEECSNPDLSPSGQLPFLSHDGQTVSTLPSIIRYVSKLQGIKVDGHSSPDIDGILTAGERAKSVAWSAHVLTNLGDLVAHMFYSLQDNWTKLIRPALANMQPVPQRYYLSDRIRDAYRPRLEAVGLWNLPGIEQKEKKPFEKLGAKADPDSLKEKYIRVFEREKVEEKAHALFEVYKRLLDDKLFFFGNRCTTLDLLFAGHVLLLTKPPFPDTLLQTILVDQYSGLVNHAERILSLAIPCDVQLSKTSTTYSLRSLFYLPHRAAAGRKVSTEEDAEERKYARMRWAFVGVAAASVVYYALQLMFLTRARASLAAESEEDAGEDADDDDDDEEEDDEEE